MAGECVRIRAIKKCYTTNTPVWRLPVSISQICDFLVVCTTINTTFLIISAVIAFVNQYVAYRITKCSIFDNLGVVICDSADETAAINLGVSSK